MWANKKSKVRLVIFTRRSARTSSHTLSLSFADSHFADLSLGGWLKAISVQDGCRRVDKAAAKVTLGFFFWSRMSSLSFDLLNNLCEAGYFSCYVTCSGGGASWQRKTKLHSACCSMRLQICRWTRSKHTFQLPKNAARTTLMPTCIVLVIDWFLSSFNQNLKRKPKPFIRARQNKVLEAGRVHDRSVENGSLWGTRGERAAQSSTFCSHCCPSSSPLPHSPVLISPLEVSQPRSPGTVCFLCFGQREPFVPIILLLNAIIASYCDL